MSGGLLAWTLRIGPEAKCSLPIVRMTSDQSWRGSQATTLTTSLTLHRPISQSLLDPEGP